MLLNPIRIIHKVTLWQLCMEPQKKADKNCVPLIRVAEKICSLNESREVIKTGNALYGTIKRR